RPCAPRSAGSPVRKAANSYEVERTSVRRFPSLPLGFGVRPPRLPDRGARCVGYAIPILETRAGGVTRGDGELAGREQVRRGGDQRGVGFDFRVSATRRGDTGAHVDDAGHRVHPFPVGFPRPLRVLAHSSLLTISTALPKPS